MDGVTLALPLGIGRASRKRFHARVIRPIQDKVGLTLELPRRSRPSAALRARKSAPRSRYPQGSARRARYPTRCICDRRHARVIPRVPNETAQRARYPVDRARILRPLALSREGPDATVATLALSLIAHGSNMAKLY